jgi:hypothetical protein
MRQLKSFAKFTTSIEYQKKENGSYAILYFKTSTKDIESYTSDPLKPSTADWGLCFRGLHLASQ